VSPAVAVVADSVVASVGAFFAIATASSEQALGAVLLAASPL